jgi:hypothetical protein
VISTEWLKPAGAVLLALACMGGTTGSTIASECEDVISGARLGPASSWNLAADGKVCSAEWAPDTSEQQNDLAAHCENRSGARYLRFQRNETTGSVVCLFRASDPESKADSSGAAEGSGKADSLILVELPELVRKWTDICLEKERSRDRETTSCWLDAAKAINSHAAEVDAPLAKQINELQAAWLHRARDLLTLQAKEKTAIQSVSLTTDGSSPPDPFAAEDVPASPSVVVPVIEQPASVEVEKPIPRKSPAELGDGEPSPQKTLQVPPNKPNQAHKAARKKIISAAGEIPAGKVAMRAEIPKRLIDAKAQSKKAAQRRIVKKQVALAVTEDKEARAKPSRPRKRLIKLPFLSKTATSSKCFLAVEWC